MLLYMSNAGYHLAGDGKVHVLMGGTRTVLSHQFLCTYIYTCSSNLTIIRL